MDRFIVRLGNVNDAAAIVDVNIATWEIAYKGVIDEAFLESRHRDRDLAVSRVAERFSNPDGVIFVAEVDGVVVGFANAGNEKTGTYDGEIYALYVAEAHHGIGIGNALINRVKTLFHAQGKKNMMIWSLTANPYRGFYQRVGGVEVARQFITIGDQSLEEIGYLFAI